MQLVILYGTSLTPDRIKVHYDQAFQQPAIYDETMLAEKADFDKLSTRANLEYEEENIDEAILINTSVDEYNNIVPGFTDDVSDPSSWQTTFPIEDPPNGLVAMTNVATRNNIQVNAGTMTPSSYSPADPLWQEYLWKDENWINVADATVNPSIRQMIPLADLSSGTYSIAFQVGNVSLDTPITIRSNMGGGTNIDQVVDPGASTVFQYTAFLTPTSSNRYVDISATTPASFVVKKITVVKSNDPILPFDGSDAYCTWSGQVVTSKPVYSPLVDLMVDYDAVSSGSAINVTYSRDLVTWTPITKRTSLAGIAGGDDVFFDFTFVGGVLNDDSEIRRISLRDNNKKFFAMFRSRPTNIVGAPFISRVERPVTQCPQEGLYLTNTDYIEIMPDTDGEVVNPNLIELWYESKATGNLIETDSMTVSQSGGTVSVTGGTIVNGLLNTGEYGPKFILANAPITSSIKVKNAHVTKISLYGNANTTIATNLLLSYMGDSVYSASETLTYTDLTPSFQTNAWSISSAG